MIAVPFIYFTLFSLLLYRKKGKKLDLSVIITAMFAVSGLFSILIDLFGYRYPDAEGYSISAGAAIAYCGLLTMCILPLALNSNLKITSLRPARNAGLLKLLAIMSFIWFLMVFVFGWSSFTKVLGSDMADARTNVYIYGVTSWTDNVPPLLRPIVIVLNILFGCSWIHIFLAFFCRYVQRLPKAFFWMFIIASLAGPYIAVIGADRSKIAYWIIAAFGMYMLYRPFLQPKEKKKLVGIGVAVVSLLVVYLAAMTIARFGERDYGSEVGAEGGVISYLGQSYIHFCLFFDTYNPPFPNLGIIFPFIGRYVFGLETGGVIIQEQMTLATGYNCGVFYTFIGQIIMGAGQVVAMVFCFIYSLTSFSILPRVTRKSGANISSLFLYFALASVLLLGLFGHYYTSPYITFSLFFFFFTLRFIK